MHYTVGMAPRPLTFITITAAAALAASYACASSLDKAALSADELLLSRKSASPATPAPAPAAETASGIAYADICGADPAALSEARDKRRSANLKALEPEIRPGFQAVVKKYGLPDLQSGDFINSALNSVSYTFPYQIEKSKGALAEFAEVIEAAVLNKMPMPDYGRIKAALIARIKSSGLEIPVKAELVNRVELTSLILPSQYIRKYITSSEELWPVIPQLVADQAWNASYEDLGGAGNPELRPNQSVIIVYPGILLAEMRGDGAPARLDFVLLHETAHSIDSGRFPSLYAGYAGCLKSAYGQSFKNWDEVLADYWAVSALPAFMPRSGGLDYLGKSYELICGTEGEAGSLLVAITSADHPSAKYRVENILGRDPGVAKVLGGQPAAVCGI